MVETEKLLHGVQNRNVPMGAVFERDMIASKFSFTNPERTTFPEHLRTRADINKEINDQN